MKITIAGDLGSGKSTIAKILAEELNHKYLSTGAIQREIARRMGLSTLELNNYADSHKEIDDEIDDNLRALNTSDSSFVVDSRLGWFFIPTSVKLYFVIDIEVAARRILNDSTRFNETYSSVNETIDSIRARKASENARFLKIYEADCANLNNFDIVINTTESKTVGISQLILDLIQQKEFSKNQIWCNPKILFPTSAADSSPSGPIEIVEKRGKWAVVNNLAAVQDAITSGKEWIPVVLKEKDTEKASLIFSEQIDRDFINKYSEALGFQFYTDPK